MNEQDLEAILADPTHPDYARVLSEVSDQYSQQYSQAKPLYEQPGSDEVHATTKKPSQIVLSPLDRNQALKHHPEFQRCLSVWLVILEKEREGVALTPEEEMMKWAPRSGFNVEAEMEASRYQLLSLEERERATMTKEELAWRDVASQLDYPNNKVEIVHLGLSGHSTPLRRSSVNNVRKDFLEPHEFQALVDRLPVCLRSLMKAGYLMG